MAIGINTGSYTYSGSTASSTKAGNAKTSASTSAKAEDGAVYEGSVAKETKATYTINKMSASDRAAIVEQMKKDQETRKNQLSELCQKMFAQQGETANLSSLFTADALKKVSAEDIAQAKEDVSEDGYWGIKQTSQRLFDFASALAGDDVDKMKEMQEAMQKGFEKATKAWGTDLPQLCQDTLAAANKLFDDYYASKNVAE